MRKESLIAECRDLFPATPASTHATQLLRPDLNDSVRLSWVEFIEGFHLIDDMEAFSSLSGEDRLALLPAMLIAATDDDPCTDFPFLDYIFGDIIAYREPEYWDLRFRATWLSLDSMQIDCIKRFVGQATEWFSEHDQERIMYTIDNIIAYQELSSD